MRLASACSGLCTEIFACKALAIPFEGDVVASEKNPLPIEVVRANLPEVAHILQSLRDHVHGYRRCARHGRICQASGQSSPRDLLVLGPPCQPFTSLRVDSPGSAERHGCKGHPLYNVLFGSGGLVETDSDDSAIALI